MPSDDKGVGWGNTEILANVWEYWALHCQYLHICGIDNQKTENPCYVDAAHNGLSYMLNNSDTTGPRRA